MNLSEIILSIEEGGYPKESEVCLICEGVHEIVIEESNVRAVRSPVTICGDIHGQLYDLLKLFKIGGDVRSMNYLFLGDYVDRGYNSVQTLMLLLSLKLKHRERITLLRGNHESRQITKTYGYYDECIRKYGTPNVWRMTTNLFDFLVLSALIDGKIFCVHGGLSPSVNSLISLRVIERKKEIPSEGGMSDLLWSDPEEMVEFWGVSPRGAGYFFGQKVTENFCHVNNLEVICRAHQLVMEGINYMFNERCITVWSAPNYCYRCGNLGAFLKYDNKLQGTVTTFQEAENTGVNPNVSIPDYFL